MKKYNASMVFSVEWTCTQCGQRAVVDEDDEDWPECCEELMSMKLYKRHEMKEI